MSLERRHNPYLELVLWFIRLYLGKLYTISSVVIAQFGFFFGCAL